MIKAGIIEDEYSNRFLLKTFISKYTPNVKIVGEAESVNAGIKLIQNEDLDLIFLDIELTDGNGFEVLNKINQGSVLVVFLTGFKKYAIKAIKHSAFDYLLKPLLISDLKKVIKRATTRIKEKKLLEKLYDNPTEKLTASKILIKENNKVKVVRTDTIIFIKSVGNYSQIHLEQGEMIMAHHTLIHYEKELPPFFFRVHKSYLINMKQIISWEAERSGEIVLSDSTKIPLSSRRKKAFVDYFYKISSR